MEAGCKNLKGTDMQNTQKVVNEFKVLPWNSLAALEDILTRMTNDGWLVEAHKLHDSVSESGWTIFRKSTWVNRPLLQRSIDLTTMYGILNRVLVANNCCDETVRQFGRQIDADIKNAVRVEGDEF